MRRDEELDSNMLKDMELMMKDTVVMQFNFEMHKYKVINEGLLPWVLRGQIEEMDLHQGDVVPLSLFTKISRNSEMITAWLASRVLPLSRANAKCIYNMLNLEQVDTPEYRAKIAVFCQAISLQDNYWIRLQGDNTTWDSINLRKNPLNEALAQAALHGESSTIVGSLPTPELTTGGAYAKAWKREDGDLWLYKAGSVRDSGPSKIEVMVSKLLDNMNVEHLQYSSAMSKDLVCCKCKCMTNDNLSMLSGMDFISYCNMNGLNPDLEMLRIDATSIYKMWIVDYLISNRDRHGQNWGFFYKSDTMEIVGCHPLYDHNNSFELEVMQNEEYPYQFGNMTIKEAAFYAIKRVDFRFYREFTKDDFLTERQFKYFKKRAKELGIRVVSDSTVRGLKTRGYKIIK